MSDACAEIRLPQPITNSQPQGAEPAKRREYTARRTTSQNANPGKSIRAL